MRRAAPEVISSRKLTGPRPRTHDSVSEVVLLGRASPTGTRWSSPRCSSAGLNVAAPHAPFGQAAGGPCKLFGSSTSIREAGCVFTWSGTSARQSTGGWLRVPVRPHVAGPQGRIPRSLRDDRVAARSPNDVPAILGPLFPRDIRLDEDEVGMIAERSKMIQDALEAGLRRRGEEPVDGPPRVEDRRLRRSRQRRRGKSAGQCGQADRDWEEGRAAHP